MHTPPPTTNAPIDWVTTLRQGDSTVHAALQQHLRQLIGRFLWRDNVRDPETLISLAVDIAYDRVLNGLGSFRGTCTFLNWVRPFASRAVIDVLRKEQRLPTTGFGPSREDDDSSTIEPVDPSPSPEELIIEIDEQPDAARTTLIAAISTCRDALSEREREALEAYTDSLYRQDGTQYRERIVQQLRERSKRERGLPPKEVIAKHKYDDALRSERVKEIAARFGVTERTIYRYTEETYKNNALVKMRSCLSQKGYQYA